MGGEPGRGDRGGDTSTPSNASKAKKTALANEVRRNRGSGAAISVGDAAGAGAEEAGRQMLSCAVRAGFGANCRVPAVGDGMPWIVGQIERQFGDQRCYLIDFFTSVNIWPPRRQRSPDPTARNAWMEVQKEALKGERLDAVLRALAGRCEPAKPMTSMRTAAESRSPCEPRFPDFAFPRSGKGGPAEAAIATVPRVRKERHSSGRLRIGSPHGFSLSATRKSR